MSEAQVRGAMPPGGMTGTAPKDYGPDRRCACGTKIMRYRKGNRCGLCEDNDERYRQFVSEGDEMADLWRSAQYPEGCRECPDDEKFKRRHASGGLCSMHYQRKKKADARVDSTKKDDFDPTEGATTRVRCPAMRCGMTGHADNIQCDASRGHAGAHMSPIATWSDESDVARYDSEGNELAMPLVDLGLHDRKGVTTTVTLEDVLHAELDEEEAAAEGDASDAPEVVDHLPGDADLLETAWTIIANANEGCWEQATEEWRGAAERWRDRFHERLSARPENACADEPEQPDNLAPHPLDYPPTDQGAADYQRDARLYDLANEHRDRLHEHLTEVRLMEAALESYNRHSARALETAQVAQGLITQLEEAGAVIAVDFPMAAPDPEPEVDPEIEAMAALQESLAGLDRDAQLRVMRWGLSRFALDRPASDHAATMDGA